MRSKENTRIHISGYRCNERLKTKTDGSKRLEYNGLWGDLDQFIDRRIKKGEIWGKVMFIITYKTRTRRGGRWKMSVL